MPKRSEKMLSTDREVAGAPVPTGMTAAGKARRAEYRISNTPGLVLRVTPGGRRTWVVRLKRPKSRRWQKFTLGTYPLIGFAKAKEETARLMVMAREGRDPFDARERAATALTFAELGNLFVSQYAKRRKRTWAEDHRRLHKDVYPGIGKFAACLVSKTDIIGVLDGIRDRGAPILANRILGLLRKVFNWAMAEGHVDRNPVQGVPPRSREEPRDRVLTMDEIATVWSALDGPQGFDEVTADALRLQLLTGARIGEITGMAKSELSLLGDPVWTLPAKRAKGGKDVARPLLPMALEIIHRRLAITPKSPFVFASPRDPSEPITAHAPTRAISRAARQGLVPDRFCPHDLRRTARTGWARLGVEPGLAKKILGHAPPRSDIDAIVYDRHVYLPEMRRALGLWESEIKRIVASKNKNSDAWNRLSLSTETQHIHNQIPPH